MIIKTNYGFIVMKVCKIKFVNVWQLLWHIPSSPLRKLIFRPAGWTLLAHNHEAAGLEGAGCQLTQP